MANYKFTMAIYKFTVYYTIPITAESPYFVRGGGHGVP